MTGAPVPGRSRPRPVVATALSLAVATALVYVLRQVLATYHLPLPPPAFDRSPAAAVIQVEQSSGPLPPAYAWYVRDVFYGDGHVVRSRMLGAEGNGRWAHSQTDEESLPPGKLDALVREALDAGLYRMTRGEPRAGAGSAAISMELLTGKAAVRTPVAAEYERAFDRLLADLLQAAGETRGKPSF